MHGVCNGAFTVVDGYDDCCLAREVLLAEVGLQVRRRVYRCTYLFKMSGNHLLHLHLHITVARIDIIELSFSTLSVVRLHLSVEIFVNVEERHLSAYVKAEVIKSCPVIFGALAGCIGVEQRRAYKDELSEVEVVAKTTRLIVDGGMTLHPTLFLHVAVCIHQAGTTVRSHAQHTLQCVQSEVHGGGLQAYEHVFGVGMLLNGEHGLGGKKRVYCYLRTVRWQHGIRTAVLLRTFLCIGNKEVYMLDCLAFSECLQRLAERVGIAARQKAVYFLSHIIFGLL